MFKDALIHSSIAISISTAEPIINIKLGKILKFCPLLIAKDMKRCLAQEAKMQ